MTPLRPHNIVNEHQLATGDAPYRERLQGASSPAMAKA